ncbi:MAG: metallophosphoesterase family protein [Candidatus Heimdallarchaeota archaeon]
MAQSVAKNTLRLLILADCHGDATQVKAIGDALDRWSFEPDAAVLAGDIGGTVHPFLIFSYIILHRNLHRNGYAYWAFKGSGRRFFEVYQANSSKKVAKAIQKITCRVYAVLGNSDLESVVTVLSEHQEIKTIFVDRHKGEIDGFQVIGASGALTYLGKKPICDNEFSPSAYSKRIFNIEKRLRREKSKDSLVITHEAPLINHETLKHGSQALTNLISATEPSLVIFGHHHQAPGIFRIGRTIAINPGPAVAGHFGLLELKYAGKRFKIRVRLFKIPAKKRSFARIIYSMRDWVLSRRDD